MSARSDRLDGCKRRALRILDAGDETGAIASMMSDLREAAPPLYDEDTLDRTDLLALLAFHCRVAKGPQAVKLWIEGFG